MQVKPSCSQSGNIQQSKKNDWRSLGYWKRGSQGAKVKYRDHRSFGARGQGSRKLIVRWRGPYRVVERSCLVYIIKNGTYQHREHGSQLAPWYQTTNEPQVFVRVHPKQYQNDRLDNDTDRKGYYYMGFQSL